MNIKFNASGLFNIFTVILVIMLLLSVAGCATDPNGLRGSHAPASDISCGYDISLAQCDFLIKK